MVYVTSEDGAPSGELCFDWANSPLNLLRELK
jgi:hypothetical protein